MSLKVLRAKVDETKAVYVALAEEQKKAEVKMRAAHDAHKAAKAALADALVKGAKPCPNCKATPHGVMQPLERPLGRFYVEIGCLPCPNHRATGMTHEEAVEAWNEGCSEYEKGQRPPASWSAKGWPKEEK